MDSGWLAETWVYVAPSFPTKIYQWSIDQKCLSKHRAELQNCMITKEKTEFAPQTFRNGEIHDWYRIVLGFSDHLVADLIAKFNLKAGDRVLDPFSGSGTTAVECKKLGIDCWGVDANPSSCFAAKVKTTWTPLAGTLLTYAFHVAEVFTGIREERNVLKKDPTYEYLRSSGMMERKWISGKRLLDVVAVKKAIHGVNAPRTITRALELALMHCFVHCASNVRFGPELYCGNARHGVSVIDDFLVRIAAMEDDLETARQCEAGQARILMADSRFLTRKSINAPRGGFDAIITSPPYPTEHDYTRNSRLELAFLEDVIDGKSLRKIKKGTIRSHTKGIYSSDCDGKAVNRVARIARLVVRIDRKAAKKDYGFARLYGKVTQEYFGGMRLHFRAVFSMLKPGARCAYVVGDQASYFQVKIATASILGDIAKAEGFKLEQIRIWRKRWATATQKYMDEHILLLRKPQKRRKPARNARVVKRTSTNAKK